MGLEAEAANVKAPFDKDGDDVFDVLKFTGATTHAQDALPKAWAGHFVRITPVGGNLHFGFSLASDAEIDSGVTATDAGASAKVGDYIADGQSEHVRLPTINSEQTLYFVREASAACDIYVRLASGPPVT